MRKLRLVTLALAAALWGSPLPASAQAPQTAPATPAAPIPGRAPPAKPAVPTTAAPVRPSTTPAVTPASGDRRVDLNSATEAQLDSLPGIGPVRAKAIIAGRPYTDMKDLVTKKVLTPGVLDGIKARVALVNINTSSAAELQRSLPGIGDVRSKAIVAGRPYASPDDLVAKKVLTQGVLDGVKDLITF